MIIRKALSSYDRHGTVSLKGDAMLIERAKLDAIWSSTQHIHQDKEEFWDFLQHIAVVPVRRILEIGAAHGGTALVWQEMADHVVSLDCGRVTHPQDFQSHLGIAGGIPDDRFHLDKVTFLIKNSHEPATLSLVRSLMPEVDLLFIDGDHSYSGAKLDWEMYSPLVRPGGVVGFHDIMYGRNKDFNSDIRTGQVFDEIQGHEKFEILRTHGIGGVRMSNSR